MLFGFGHFMWVRYAEWLLQKYSRVQVVLRYDRTIYGKYNEPQSKKEKRELCKFEDRLRSWVDELALGFVGWARI